MSEVCDQAIRFAYTAGQVDAVPHKQRTLTVRARLDRPRSTRLAIELHQKVRRTPFIRMAQEGNWAEAGKVVKRRDYTAAFLESATLWSATDHSVQ